MERVFRPRDVADRPSPGLSLAFWTDARIAELKSLHARGWTFFAIANKLGTTKNACIAKARRIGLARSRQYLPNQTKTVALLKPENLASLYDLGPRDCRFPHGHPGEPDFGFCAAPCELGESFCPNHRSIVWVRVPIRSAA